MKGLRRALRASQHRLRRRIAIAWIVGVGLGLAGACITPASLGGDSFVVLGVEDMRPLQHWRTLYEEVEDCVGQRGPGFDGIIFKAAREIWTAEPACVHPSTGAPVNCRIMALTNLPRNVIVIERAHIGVDWVVRHEFIHHILRILDHPDELFRRCAFSDQ